MLRNTVESDAEEIYKIFNLAHVQTDFLCTYPDEDLFDIKQEQVFLSEMEQSASKIEICAVIDEYMQLELNVVNENRRAISCTKV